MAIFQFFKMAEVRHLGFSKVGNFNFRSHSEAQICITVPNFAKIGPEIHGRFSIFQDGGCRHLGFWKFQIFNGSDAQEGQTASACQILSKSLKPRLRYGDFSIFLRWRPSAILDFQKLQISTSGPVRRPKMRHRTKFREDRSNRSGDMADYRFFKMAAAAILDFGNFKFLTVGTLKSVELRLHAKFWRNRAKRG